MIVVCMGRTLASTSSRSSSLRFPTCYSHSPRRGWCLSAS